ncbi:hypothetical protein JSO59_008865 [Riemerella anatipestifer]|uniref:hypothetical protein n=1 Tax=Riemerella anatipestifer TaxID=34085 RepID=UPI003BFA6D75
MKSIHNRDHARTSYHSVGTTLILKGIHNPALARFAAYQVGTTLILKGIHNELLRLSIPTKVGTTLILKGIHNALVSHPRFQIVGTALILAHGFVVVFSRVRECIAFEGYSQPPSKITFPFWSWDCSHFSSRFVVFSAEFVNA